jgi:hypothetical protein
MYFDGSENRSGHVPALCWAKPFVARIDTKTALKEQNTLIAYEQLQKNLWCCREVSKGYLKPQYISDNVRPRQLKASKMQIRRTQVGGT